MAFDAEERAPSTASFAPVRLHSVASPRAKHTADVASAYLFVRAERFQPSCLQRRRDTLSASPARFFGRSRRQL
jgi:hypothetical protein